MMPSQRTLVLLLASIAASPAAAFHRIPGVKRMDPSWTPPAQTSTPDPTAVDGSGFSPKPTDAPNYAIMELVKRMDGFTMGTDTCGYIPSYWANSFTCVEAGASCTNDGTFLGCCRGTGAACTSSLKQTCVDFQGFGEGKCNGMGSNTLCCSEAAVPFCYTYTLPQTKGPLSGRALTLFDCDMMRGEGSLIDFPPAFTHSNLPPSTSGVPRPADATATLDPAAISAAAGQTAGPQTPNVPAIVGGVVGGVGGIALIAAAAFFLLRRRSGKGKRRADDGTSGPYGGAGSSLLSRAGPAGGKAGGLLTEKEGWTPGSEEETAKKSGAASGRPGFLGGSGGKYTPLAGDGEQTAAPYDDVPSAGGRQSTEYRGAREVVQVGAAGTGPYAAEPLYDPMPPKEARRASYMGPPASGSGGEFDAGAQMPKESRRISMGPLVAGGVAAGREQAASIAPSPMPSPVPSPNQTPTPTPNPVGQGGYSPPMEYRAYRGTGGGMQ